MNKALTDLFNALANGSVTSKYPNQSIQMVQGKLAVVLRPPSNTGGIAVFIQDTDLPANWGQLLLRCVAEIGKL